MVHWRATNESGFGQKVNVRMVTCLISRDYPGDESGGVLIGVLANGNDADMCN